jgi:hypothetical protein
LPYPNVAAGPPVPGSAGWQEDNAWVQMRTIMAFVAAVNKDLYGALVFEIDSSRWGESGATSDLSTVTPGMVGGAAGSGRAGAWGTDQIAVEVKNAYINFKIPQVPVTVKAGIQSYAVRPVVCLLKDAAGITAAIELKTDPVTVTIAPMWAKILEGVDNTEADDQDLYGINLSFAFGDIKPGVFFLYQARRQLYDGTPSVEGDSTSWWLGPYIDAKIGPVDATLDFVYNGGTEEFQDGSPFADIDRGGWILRGQVAVTMNKLRIGIGGLYGTGDDLTTNDDESYRVPYISEAAAANQDFLILTGDWVVNAPYGFNQVGGFFKPFSDVGAGVWYVRAFADYQLLSWLTVMGNVGYIGDTTKHGDTFGRDLDDDRSIGWEMDVGTSIAIYKNLSWNTAFGYLIAHKALAGTGGHMPQDPWALATTLVYAF